MLALLLIASSSATHVTTYEQDNLRTTGTFAGMESLIVDPATAIPALQPLTAAPVGGVEKLANGKGGSGTVMVFTNPASTWAWLNINGTRVGTISPYGTITVQGMKPGWYSLDLEFPTGFTRRIAVELK